jgi:endonuclease
MRLVVAECTVDYAGRLTAHLPRARRLIMVKADGCVAIHADGGAYKPLNWMNAPNTLIESDDGWEVTNPKGERLVISFHEIVVDTSHDLGVDPACRRTASKPTCRYCWRSRPWILEDGLSLLRREYPTDIGPVDLLCSDSTGGWSPSRSSDGERSTGSSNSPGTSNASPRLPAAPVRGILAAQSVTPQARTLGEARGLMVIEVDYDGLREVESDDLTLF